MNIFPYIGITDFTSTEQVRTMRAVFQKHFSTSSKRKLHIGVMISHKTLNGIPTIWSEAFPPKDKIADIFAFDDVYNCLHYVDYIHNSDFKDFARAIGYGGINIHAIQLDMIWPDPGQVANGVHTSRKNIEVILQVGNKAIEEAHNDPTEVVQRLEDYEKVIHRVLLDKSMGRGHSMDAIGLLPFVRAIKERFPDMGLVVAGGLSPDSINLVGPLAKEFPDISIDAQGKLRPSGNTLNPIDWGMAEAYLIKALELFK